MRKILLMTIIFITVIVFSGCSLLDGGKEKEEVINPFRVDSMVDTYDNSKERINDTVQMENDKINKALEESGLQ